MSIRFYNTNDEGSLAGSLDIEEIKPFPLFIRPNAVYDGEYGYDYVRTDFCKLDSRNDETICKDVTELDKQYEILQIKETDKYHVPWLCMFPNHKDVVDKDVVVSIWADINDVMDVSDKDGNALIEIKPSNPALRCTPEIIQLDELYNPKNITITCDGPLVNQESIEFRLKSEFLNGGDKEKGLLIGKINVVKNSDYREYKVPVYVVFTYLIDVVGFDIECIENLINDSKIGGLQGIEDYLNKHSLNQALIQVKITNKVNYRPWEFTWNRSLKAVSGGVNPTRGTADNVYKYFKGLIVDETNIIVNSKLYFDYTHSQFSKRNFDDVPERGAILYLSSLKAGTVGGSSAALPTNNRQCIVYQSNLKSLSTYAHELGHVFGLCHPFLEKDSSGNEISIQNNINERIALITNKLANVQSTESRNFNNNISYYKKNKEEEKEDRKFFANYKQYWQGYINDFPTFLNRDKLRFEEGGTNNIMDYIADENAKHFTKRQWEIMQQEVKEYYNEK